MKDSDLKQINFIMLLGQGLHRYGATSDRIERALTLVCEKQNIQGQFFSTPTAIMASFKSDNEEEEVTRLIRLEPGKANLEKLLKVDQTVDLVLEKKITIDEGRQRLWQVINKPTRFSGAYVSIGFALIAASASVILKGSWLDATCSFFIGLVVGFFSENVKKERIDSIFDAVIAFSVALTIHFLAGLGIGVNPQVSILANLIILLPGLLITMAVMELASQNLTSGTARLVGSVMVLLKLSFGVYIAKILSQAYFTSSITQGPASLASWIVYPAVFFLSIGFIFIFQASKKDSKWIIIATFTSFLISKAFLALTDQPASSFLTGAVIGSLSNIFARATKRPAMIFLLPSIIILVPGSIGLQSLDFMFNHNTLKGIDSAFNTASIATALGSGVFFGNVFVKPKRSL